MVYSYVYTALRNVSSVQGHPFLVARVKLTKSRRRCRHKYRELPFHGVHSPHHGTQCFCSKANSILAATLMRLLQDPTPQNQNEWRLKRFTLSVSSPARDSPIPPSNKPRKKPERAVRMHRCTVMAGMSLPARILKSPCTRIHAATGWHYARRLLATEQRHE